MSSATCLSASARWPPPRPRAGCAPTCPASTFPDAIIDRLEGAADQKAEGKRLCIDIINEVKEIDGVHGVHVMAYRQEEYVAEIVAESGVLKGRKPWQREARRDEATVVERLDALLHRDAISPQEHGRPSLSSHSQ